MYLNCWDVLGIEPTRDEDLIRRAYAKKLKITRPDDDPEGFQNLIDARETAFFLAAYPDETDDDFEEDEEAAPRSEAASKPPLVSDTDHLDQRREPHEEEHVSEPQPESSPEPDEDPNPRQELYDELDRLIAKANRGREAKNWLAAEWQDLLKNMQNFRCLQGRTSKHTLSAAFRASSLSQKNWIVEILFASSRIKACSPWSKSSTICSV